MLERAFWLRNSPPCLVSWLRGLVFKVIGGNAPEEILLIVVSVGQIADVPLSLSQAIAKAVLPEALDGLEIRYRYTTSWVDTSIISRLKRCGPGVLT